MNIIILLFCVVSANTCYERTKIYYSHLKSNSNNYYFDKATYSSTTDLMNNQQYRNFIIKSVPCTGVWCVENQWKCNINDSKNCYNVEHIIPKSNSIKEIEGCSLDVRGNLIMAYGAWNQELSNEYYGEKAEIYGTDIVKSAYEAVYYSCYKLKYNFKDYPNELCLQRNSLSVYVIAILILSIFTIIGITILLYNRYVNKIKNIEMI